MALVDSRRRGIDDDEHLGGKILAAAIEDDAGHIDRIGVVRTLVQVELQRRQPMLAIDDQVFRRRLVQDADAAIAAGSEGQPLGGKQQHGSRDRRLRDRGFVEILELTDLAARNLALECLIGAFYLRDELCDLVILGDAPGVDFLPLAVKAADETHLRQQLLRAVANEVEDAIFLPDLSRLHSS